MTAILTRRRSLLHRRSGYAGGDPTAYLHWDASAIVGVADAALLPYTSVLDQSGNGRHAAAMNSSFAGPEYAANGFGVGRAGMYFPSDSMFRFPDLTALTELDFFVSVRRNQDFVEGADNTFAPIYRLGNSGSRSAFCANDSNWYDDAGSSTMHLVTNPTPPIDVTHVINIVSTATEWSAYLDDVLQFTTATNTVALPAGILCSLGGLIDAGFLHAGFFGLIGECRIYATKRTSLVRSAIVSAMLANRAGTTGGTWKRWRLRVTASEAGGNIAIAELQFRPTVGAAATESGGTPIFTVQQSGFPASAAYDGSVSSAWAANGVIPAALGYEKATASAVNEIMVQAWNDPTFFSLAPKDFTVQSASPYGNAWLDEWAVTGQTGWTPGEVRTFARPP